MTNSLAGRFLYVDWFDAYRDNAIGGGVEVLQCCSAHYHAYRNPRIRHTRTVTAFADESWKIEDELLVVPSIFHLNGQNMAEQQTSRNRSFQMTSRQKNSPPVFRLHWLLPDWEWELVPLSLNTKVSGCELHLHSPEGWISVRIKSDQTIGMTEEDKLKIGLVRSGVCIYGIVEPSQVDGWFSPTYGIRMPALSLSMTQATPGCANFVTEFIFPK